MPWGNALMFPRESMENVGRVAFTEQVTFNQIFEISANESLRYLEEENSRQRDSLYKSPEAGCTWCVGGKGRRPVSGTEEARAVVVGAEVREGSRDGAHGGL